MKFISLFLLLLLPLLTFAQDYTALQAMLDLDRFEAYTEAWAATMRGRGKAPIADAIHKFEPADFRAMNLDPAKLKNAQNYDALILQVLNTRHPELRATAAEVDWGYNFFKNKLNEAYLVNDVRTRANQPDPTPVLHSDRVPTQLDMPALNSEEVLLDVDAYASDRTTRAVFWEASDSRRPIELFVGSGGDFQDEIARRGARIVGEVGTKARNYNPIYLIQNPGETGYHYAITEISGADRVRHFQLQSSLVRWTNASGVLAAPPPVSVVGDAASVLAEERSTLASVLRNIPRADHTVIGQKGAFERTFGSLGKIQAILALHRADPAAVTALLTPAELKIITRAQEASGDLTPFVMKFASDVDKLYVKTTPLLTQRNLLSQPFTVFNYDRGSYEMSDYVVRGADGKDQRWRIFSNVWGDEVLPIAQALKETGTTTVDYIGTAGAFPNTGFKVGDLVIPETATDINGNITHITRSNTLNPQGAKYARAVVNVQSPFEETHDWLRRAGSVSQVVEVETGYLASVFNGPNDRLNVQLLISDVVGSEDETLATAASSSRRRAQISALTEIIGDAGVVSTGTVAAPSNQLLRWISEIVPSRDIVSASQIARSAQAAGITTKPALEAFIKTQKSFTTAKLELVLSGADSRLARITAELRTMGINPEVALSADLLDGRFNPAVSGAGVHLNVPADKEARARQLIDSLIAQDKDYRKFLNVTVGTTIPKDFISQGAMNEIIPSVRPRYQDGLMQFSGLAYTENSSGALKFVRVADASTEPFTFHTRPLAPLTGPATLNSGAICLPGVCTDCKMSALNNLLK
ncbi:MAG: hypothetical protein V4598_10090 [Bdellovibrionota bacterium]